MTKTFEAAQPIWCAGCGDFAVLAAVRKALSSLQIPRKDVVVVAGIGCSGSLQNSYESYGYHAVHGRLLSTALGIKLANPLLTVIAVGGDGDGYAIGMSHFIHTLKRNPSIVYIVMNNETYGLTKGQFSPTSHPGFHGNVEEAFDPILTGLSLPRASFLSRGFSGTPAQLTKLTGEAVKHSQANRGLAFLEVLSPCVTYNDTYSLWRHITYDLDQEQGYNSADRKLAFSRVMDLSNEGKIPVGLIFRNESPALETVSLPDIKKPMALEDISLEPNKEKYYQLMSTFR